MTQAPTTTFDIAQSVFNMLRFSATTPLALPVLDMTKPPVTLVERNGIPDHNSFRDLVTLIARAEDYRTPTRWNDKASLVTTGEWATRHEDGCDVRTEVKGVLNKTDSLRMVLDGQVGCAELLYRSKKPLFAVGQFTAASPYHLSSLAFCAGVDMIGIVGKHTEDKRGTIWKRLAKLLAEKKIFEEIEAKFTPLTSDIERVVPVNTSTSGGNGLILRSGREDYGYEPGTRLGWTRPFSLEYRPRKTSSDLFGRTLDTRTLVVKQDLIIDREGKQEPYALVVQEFMAALEATNASLFSEDAK